MRPIQRLRAVGPDRALKILPDAYEIIERKVYALRQAGFDLH